MAYHYGSCGSCGPIRRRKKHLRTVFGCSNPCFDIKFGETLDFCIDVSDEASWESQVITAAPEAGEGSSIDGTVPVGVVSLSVQSLEQSQVIVFVNADDANLQAGDNFPISVSVQMDDGRRLSRCFRVRIRGCATSSCLTSKLASACDTAPTTGVVIAGSGATIPGTCAAGLFTLTAPLGATYARLQALTPLVWTTSGLTPDDNAGVGYQLLAGSFITLESANEIASFRATGTNSGADKVQFFIEYYTGPPA